MNRLKLRPHSLYWLRSSASFPSLTQRLLFATLPLVAPTAMQAQQQTPPGVQPQPNLIITENFETGWDMGIQTQDHRCSNLEQMFSLVSTPVRSGQRALKTQITNCDERAEIVARTQFARDKTYWLGWSMYVPENYFKPGDSNAAFTIVQQLVHFAPAWDYPNSFRLKCGNPPHSVMILNRTPTNDYLSYRVTYPVEFQHGVTTLDCQTYAIPLTKNQWQDFVMQVRLSESQTGFLKLWMNDTLYIDYQGPLLTQDRRFGPGDIKFGVYVGDPNRGERTVYFDDLKIGDASASYQAVRSEKVQFRQTLPQ